MLLTTLFLLAGLGVTACAYAQEGADAEYITRFDEQFPKADPVPTLEAYATAADYDGRYLGDALDKALEKISNQTGGIAWGMSARMRSLNDMFRATKDAKYLRANLRCVQAVLAVRDDKTGVKTWTDVVAPAWSSGKYAERGQAVFAVHTGVITHPMFDLILLAKESPEFQAELGDQAAAIATASTESLDFHDRQWRDGPGEGEGHYIGVDQENVCENKPLPGNRLSAMGIALWQSWKVTGNETHRDRARAIGVYVKNRLTPAPDGAYYWPYWLPEEAVAEPQPKEAIKGEDVSHAGLTMALPFLLAADGEVFTKEDMVWVGNTVIKGFGRLGEGILFGVVTGDPAAKPNYAASSARWLPVVQFAPEVRDVLVPFFLRYKKTPGYVDIPLLMIHGSS